MQTWDNIASKIRQIVFHYEDPDPLLLAGGYTSYFRPAALKTFKKEHEWDSIIINRKIYGTFAGDEFTCKNPNMSSLDIMFSIVGHTSLVNHQNSPPGWGSLEFMSACPLLLLPPKWSACHHQRPCQPHPHRHASWPAGPRTT